MSGVSTGQELSDKCLIFSDLDKSDFPYYWGSPEQILLDFIL
jgi:hypothetical protein